LSEFGQKRTPPAVSRFIQKRVPVSCFHSLCSWGKSIAPFIKCFLPCVLYIIGYNCLCLKTGNIAKYDPRLLCKAIDAFGDIQGRCGSFAPLECGSAVLRRVPQMLPQPIKKFKPNERGQK
jgi:hypothetical protein